jgi:N utilization substance protein B
MTDNLDSIPEETPEIDQEKNENIDPRHQRRMDLVQQLFSKNFNQDRFSEADAKEYDPIITTILDKATELDTLIAGAAPERPLTEINKVDLAILRLIMFESESTKTPKKVLINEAVELAKKFGTESSPRFINAVLGKLLISSVVHNKD